MTKCLAKDPGARYADASPLLADLEAVCREIDGPPPIEARSIVASLRRPAIAIPLLLVVAAAAFGIYRWNERRARESWARQTAIPEAQRLMGENRRFEAYELAVEARAVVGADPALEALWPLVTTPFRVTTDPPGANVSYRPYRAASQPESSAGGGSDGGSPTGYATRVDRLPRNGARSVSTPYLEDHFPVGAFRFRIEKEGFEPVEVARSLLPGDWIESLNRPSTISPTPATRST